MTESDDEVYLGGEVEYDAEVGGAVVYAPAKDFSRWFDDFTKPYEPLIAALSEAFGAQFYMQHTGGGCMALEALLEGGLGLMITDAVDVLDRDNWDGRYGYAVGVYPLEECDCWTVKGGPKCSHPPYPAEEATGWASSPAANSTAKLIKLIGIALLSTKHAEPNAACTGHMGHIDPELLED